MGVYENYMEKKTTGKILGVGKFSIDTQFSVCTEDGEVDIQMSSKYDACLRLKIFHNWHTWKEL